MKILILAKTKMNNNRVCVGGIDVETNRLVRLLNQGGNAILSNTNLDIGDIWEIDCTDSPNPKAPHVEDVIIGKRNKIGRIEDIRGYIEDNDVSIWIGGINNIFDQCLGWTSNGSGYISSTKIPTQSVGFWVSDKDLTYENSTYIYKGNLFSRDKRIAYKGHKDPVKIIPKGTLIRVSLARWWKPENVEMEQRCYLQLSGWY